jgi:hypothetical protein
MEKRYKVQIIGENGYSAVKTSYVMATSENAARSAALETWDKPYKRVLVREKRSEKKWN